MKPDTRKYEKQFVRVRNAIERKAITLTKKALREQYQFMVDKIRQTDISQWMQIPENLPKKPIQDLLNTIYPMCAPLATMERKHLLRQKADTEEQVYNSVFQRKLTLIAQTLAGEKIVTITNTTKTQGLKVIRAVLDEADTEGWGVDVITREIYKQMNANLRGNAYARAKAIAQTEIISASNQASEAAANSTGYDYLKFWSTSGLPNIRESHIYAETMHADGIAKDANFDMGNGNFMEYPGDPNGAAEEVINCRCTLMHEII
jgi:hypothetical protein